MVQKSKKILFFIADSSPTEEEAAAAAKLNTRMFRNVSLYSEDHALEPCDGVAGLAPKAYVAKYGKVEVPRERPVAEKAPEKK